MGESEGDGGEVQAASTSTRASAYAAPHALPLSDPFFSQAFPLRPWGLRLLQQDLARHFPTIGWGMTYVPAGLVDVKTYPELLPYVTDDSTPC